MKKFSDFSDENILDGKKLRIEEILNHEITIIGGRVTGSKYANKKCLTLQYELDGCKHISFTGSSVLINQIEKYMKEIPFKTTIIKIDKYFTFS